MGAPQDYSCSIMRKDARFDLLRVDYFKQNGVLYHRRTIGDIGACIFWRSLEFGIILLPVAGVSPI
jgi:hypothetical protein